MYKYLISYGFDSENEKIYLDIFYDISDLEEMQLRELFGVTKASTDIRETKVSLAGIKYRCHAQQTKLCLFVSENKLTREDFNLFVKYGNRKKLEDARIRI